jgi:hypothetical protein
MSNGDSSRELPHLDIPTSANRLDYEPVGGGGSSSDTPNRDREEHSRKLLRDLDEVFDEKDELEQRREDRNIPGCDGDVLSVEVTDPSKITRLEDARQDRELLAYKPFKAEEEDSEEDGGVATIYVPFNEFEKFGEKIQKYREEETKGGNPKNRALVERIDEIGRAVLRERWTDPVEEEPPSDDEEDWWEVWVRAAVDHDVVEAQMEANGLEICSEPLEFPGRRVYLVHGVQNDLADSFELLDSVAELRRARPVVQEFLGLSTERERDWLDDLADRVEGPDDSDPAVCVLDTGLYSRHILLEPAVNNQNVDTARAQWRPRDTGPRTHGTQMGGIALYGQYLADHLAGTDPVDLQHWLESVKILPPNGNDPEAYGSITKEAVATAEINDPGRNRVFSMAITEDPSKDGRPTS